MIENKVLRNPASARLYLCFRRDRPLCRLRPSPADDADTQTVQSSSNQICWHIGLKGPFGPASSLRATGRLHSFAGREEPHERL